MKILKKETLNQVNKAVALLKTVGAKTKVYKDGSIAFLVESEGTGWFKASYPAVKQLNRIVEETTTQDALNVWLSLDHEMWYMEDAS